MGVLWITVLCCWLGDVTDVPVDDRMVDPLFEPVMLDVEAIVVLLVGVGVGNDTEVYGVVVGELVKVRGPREVMLSVSSLDSGANLVALVLTG